MTRDEEIIQASIDYTKATRPKAIGGDAFSDLVDAMNVNPSFIDGAKWADSHPVNPWHTGTSPDLESVLVTNGKKCEVAYYDYRDEEWSCHWRPDYWMPLPELPEDDLWRELINSEDRRMLLRICHALKSHNIYDDVSRHRIEPYKDEIEWIKSLTAKTKWLASDKQIEALDRLLCVYSKFPYLEDYVDDIKSLYNDLVKLRRL